jgi:hypothetical protein
MAFLKKYSFPLWIIACNIIVILMQSVVGFFLTDSSFWATFEPTVILASLTTIIITTMVQLFIDERKISGTMSLLLWAMFVIVLGVFILAIKDAPMPLNKHVLYTYAVYFVSIASAIVSFKLLCRVKFESIDVVDDRRHDQSTLNNKLKKITEVKNDSGI